MPSKASRKKKASKNMANKPKATANKDDLEGIDDLLNDPEVMQNIQLPEISGQRSAQIGLEGFQKAAQDPKMFQDAMGLLKDPSAVAEAEKMMKDPEFASEINKQLAGLKQDPSFAQAMAAAQEKFKVLMADPAKMEEMMKQMQGLMGGAGEGGFDLEGAAALLGGGGAAAAAATGGDERKAGEGLADPEVD